MRKIAAGTALAVALMSAPVAHADPSVWLQCDGQPKPEGAATTAARIGAMVFIPIVGLLAAGEMGTGTPAASGQRGVDACTQALAEPVLASFWQRHINILRARAIHYIEIQNYDAALSDLTAMHSVGEGQAASPLLDRSLGVSALLLEAALRARAGDFDRARTLAVQAADARPYSRPIQRFASRFFIGADTVSQDERRLLTRSLSYEPSDALILPARLDQTDDAQGAADAWEGAIAAGDTLTKSPSAESDGYTLLRAALAVARANRLARASELAERADARLGPETGTSQTAPADPEAATGRNGTGADQQGASGDAKSSQVEAILAASAAPFRPLLRAWLASERGDDPAALAIVEENFDRLPRVMATADLLRRLSLNRAISAQVPSFLIQAAVAGARPNLAQRFQELQLDALIRALPQFERVDGNARYRAGGNPGYSEHETRDGATQIVYSGASFYAGSEMLLLRAAQLAQERGFDSYLVLELSPLSMTVVFMNAASPPEAYAARAGRLVTASDVIANLGPIYIDIPAAMEAARHAH